METQNAINVQSTNNYIRVRASLGFLLLIVAIFIIWRYKLGFWAGCATLLAGSLLAGLASMAIAPLKIETKEVPKEPPRKSLMEIAQQNNVIPKK